MTKINNAKEWEDFYHYKSKPRKYPKSYPCYARKESEDCGIMGSAWYHYACYAPNSEVSPTEAFELGLGAQWELIC